MTLDRLRGVDPATLRQAGRTDRELRKVDRQLSGADLQIARGLLAGPFTVTTTPTEFQHGLGRAWVGCFAVRADTPSFVSASAAADDATHVTLTGSAASAEVSVWVF